MSSEPFQTLQRQWAMLRAIPRWPLKISASAIFQALVDGGFKPSRRTLDRDLKELPRYFPLVVDTSSRPYGWSWAKDANFEFMPRLTVAQAVALKLVQAHSLHLLPKSMQKDLAPLFEAATRELKHSGWRDWHRRIVVKPPTLELLPPAIDATVLADVQQAIARRLMFKARYRKKGAKTPIDMVVHSQGMLVRGSVQYVMGLLFDGLDMRQLALHRMSAVEVSGEPCREPPDFDFQQWVDEKLTLVSRGKIRLVARFNRDAADHLLETKLSNDQAWQPVEDGARVEVTATRDDDELLRWWLLAFGPKVEVLEPPGLRAMIAEDLRKASALYGVVST